MKYMRMTSGDTLHIVRIIYWSIWNMLHRRLSRGDHASIRAVAWYSRSLSCEHASYPIKYTLYLLQCNINT